MICTSFDKYEESSNRNSSARTFFILGCENGYIVSMYIYIHQGRDLQERESVSFHLAKSCVLWMH